MSLIVESGAGLPDAESYCSVAQADAHFAARGTTTWATMTETEKEQALRRGTDYLEAYYGARLGGYRVGTVQALSWPRYDAPRRGLATSLWWESNVVPADIVKACAEAAIRAAAGDIAPDVGRLKSRVKVGPIETEYVAGGSGLTKFTAIDRLMQPFVGGGGSMNMQVVRA